MSRIAIATDSNSGITQAQAKELGIFVLPMPFYINDELFLEDITLTQEQFYQKLEEGADVKTTQPAPGDVIEFWDKLLRDYDEIVHIPMSSGLSSTCETAEMLSEDYGGKVQVVNNQRISVTQRQSALDALALANAGWSAKEIKELLEKTKFDSDIYITVDTLKYLKKGGRCTPAAAAIGTVLGIKPVLRIKGEKLDSFAKARGWKAAKPTATARRISTSPWPTPAPGRRPRRGGPSWRRPSPATTSTWIPCPCPWPATSGPAPWPSPSPRPSTSKSKKRLCRFFEKGCMAKEVRFLAKLSPLPP